MRDSKWKLLVSIPAAAASLLFLAAGAGGVARWTRSGPKLDGERLARHALGWFAVGAGGLTAIGLLLGRLPWFMNASNWERAGFYLAALALVLASSLGLRAIWTGKLNPLERWACPHCGSKRSRVLVTPMGVLFNLWSCVKCGGIRTAHGRELREAPPSKRGPALRLTAAGLAATFIGAAGGVLAAGTLWTLAGAVAFRNAHAEVAMAGFSFERPENSPKLPDMENSAYFLQQAGEAKSIQNLDVTSGGKLLRFLDRASRGELSAKDLDAARALLRDNSGPVALARAALDKNSFDWGVDWNVPVLQLAIPRFAGIMKLERLLAVQAVVAAREGRGREAVTAVRSLFALSDSIGQTPEMISAIIGQWSQRLAARTADSVLTKVPLSDAEKAWLPYLDDRRVSAEFGRALSFELAYKADWAGSLTWRDVPWLKALGLPGGASQPDPDALTGGAFDSSLVWYLPFIGFDVAQFERAGIGLRKQLLLPYAEGRAGYGKAFEEFQRSAWYLGAMAMPNLQRLYDKALMAETDTRMTKLALELERSRRRSGRWPETLAGLKTPADDPFTGTPFKLKRSGADLLLYSVGPDLKDDGGKDLDPSTNEGDVVCRLSAR